MSTGSFFGDPWGDDDDPSQPQPFLGGPLQDALRQQSAGWGSPLLPLASQPSLPGSLVPPGATFANLAGSPIRLAANVVVQPGGVRPDSGVSGTPDQAPMPPPPYGPVPDEIKTQIGNEVEGGLERAGQAAGIVGPIMGKIPGLGLWGHGIDIVGKILDDAAARAGIAGYIKSWIVNDIQDDLNRINNAYGQQQFINGGGMPHR